MDRSAYFGGVQQRDSRTVGALAEARQPFVASVRPRFPRATRSVATEDAARSAALREEHRELRYCRIWLARQYDIRNVTPYEIDALASKLPAEGADSDARVSLLSYGAEFRRNLALTAWRAGLTAEPGEALEAHLHTGLDLIDTVEKTARHPVFADRTCEKAKAFITWLYRFADLRTAGFTRSTQV